MRGQERAQLCLTSPHGEGTGRAMQGRERRKKAERPLASQGDGKVWNRVGFGGRGRLFPTGELIDPFRQIQVQHIDADRALARIVSLAAQAFHQRLGKGAVSPGLIFQRILLAGGGGKDHGTVLRAGQLADHDVNVCRAWRRQSGPSRSNRSRISGATTSSRLHEWDHDGQRLEQQPPSAFEFIFG